MMFSLFDAFPDISSILASECHLPTDLYLLLPNIRAFENKPTLVNRSFRPQRDARLV
jgi:hypothetical protein